MFRQDWRSPMGTHFPSATERTIGTSGRTKRGNLWTVHDIVFNSYSTVDKQKNLTQEPLQSGAFLQFAKVALGSPTQTGVGCTTLGVECWHHQLPRFHRLPAPSLASRRADPSRRLVRGMQCWGLTADIIICRTGAWHTTLGVECWRHQLSRFHWLPGGSSNPGEGQTFGDFLLWIVVSYWIQLIV